MASLSQKLALLTLTLMVGDDLFLSPNCKIDKAKLPPYFSNLLPHIYRVNHCFAFDKRADEEFIEAPIYVLCSTYDTINNI